MLVPVPCTLTTGNGNRMISVNNLRHEFLLSFFALVECWDSTDSVRSCAHSHVGTYDRGLSPFCALLHSFILTHLSMSDDDRQLEDIQLESRDRSEHAQETLKCTQDFLRDARLPAYVALFAEWHCGWLRQFLQAFDAQALRACHTQAFESVHKLVSGPSSDCPKAVPRQVS